MKKRTLAVLMAGAMAASLMAGVVSVYADVENKTLTVGLMQSILLLDIRMIMENM